MCAHFLHNCVICAIWTSQWVHVYFIIVASTPSQWEQVFFIIVLLDMSISLLTLYLDFGVHLIITKQQMNYPELSNYSI